MWWWSGIETHVSLGLQRPRGRPSTRSSRSGGACGPRSADRCDPGPAPGRHRRRSTGRPEGSLDDVRLGDRSFRSLRSYRGSGLRADAPGRPDRRARRCLRRSRRGPRRCSAKLGATATLAAFEDRLQRHRGVPPEAAATGRPERLTDQPSGSVARSPSMTSRSSASATSASAARRPRSPGLGLDRVAGDGMRPGERLVDRRQVPVLDAFAARFDDRQRPAGVPQRRLASARAPRRPASRATRPRERLAGTPMIVPVEPRGVRCMDHPVDVLGRAVLLLEQRPGVVVADPRRAPAASPGRARAASVGRLTFGSSL